MSSFINNGVVVLEPPHLRRAVVQNVVLRTWDIWF